ncbi:MAG: hypothetical protein Q8K92_08225 [Leadbetterella sp.]|nr:hypothetical protein [Leadbetterella sp.]
MSGLGDFEQMKFEFARSGRKLETALEMLKTMPMPEPQKKKGIIGAGSVGRAVAHACVERGLAPILISLDSVGGPDMRGKAMIMEIPPDYSFLDRNPMHMLHEEMFKRIDLPTGAKVSFDVPKVEQKINANALTVTMTAKAYVPQLIRKMFWKLPRKKKKAYIAKYGRLMYRWNCY